MAKAKKAASTETGADAGATRQTTAQPAGEAGAKAKKPAAAKKGAEGATAAAGSGGGAAAKKSQSAGQPAKAATGSAAPLIDTSLAAAAAAAMVGNRPAVGGAAAPVGGAPQRKESSSFRQMKESLSKPTGQGLGGILGATGNQKKSNTSFGGGNQQVGRNQTFGADINRAGVPRRTGG